MVRDGFAGLDEQGLLLFLGFLRLFLGFLLLVADLLLVGGHEGDGLA